MNYFGKFIDGFEWHNTNTMAKDGKLKLAIRTTETKTIGKLYERAIHKWMDYEMYILCKYNSSIVCVMSD